MAGGGAAHYLATGQTTGGAFGLYRWDMGAQPSGPSPHFHRSITESFFVLNGAPAAARRTAMRSTPARGTSSTSRSGGVHGFRNESGEPASMLLLVHALVRRARTTSRPWPTPLAARPWVRRTSSTDFYLRHDTFWGGSGVAGRRPSGGPGGVAREGLHGGRDGAGPRRHPEDDDQYSVTGCGVVRLPGPGLRIDGGPGGLARRTPPGDAFLRAGPARRAGPGCRNGGRLALAAEHSTIPAAPGVAGRVLVGVVFVGAA